MNLEKGERKFSFAAHIHQSHLSFSLSSFDRSLAREPAWEDETRNKNVRRRQWRWGELQVIAKGKRAFGDRKAITNEWKISPLFLRVYISTILKGESLLSWNESRNCFLVWNLSIFFEGISNCTNLFVLAARREKHGDHNFYPVRATSKRNGISIV